ncbi:MAG: MBL fold metallo-hydrolase [Proteobacteria bacterium]|nr:MBL fold metallo-hydrolase [Pseudomonadota bacterium]
MTGPGTNTYLLGERHIAVIDPGPAIDTHIQQIIDVAAAPVLWILVTHTHPDHSPAAMALATATGAEVLGIPAPQGRHQDSTFSPDRILADRDVFSTDEFELEVVHTPGHASNHLCYLHTDCRWLFTGDHIINGSTVVIDPPDGSMSDYIQSLQKLRSMAIDALAPGHGAVLENVEEALNWIISHRLEREAKVVEKLAAHPATSLAELVVHVYDDVNASLHSLAERSLLAHLLKLELEGRAIQHENCWCLKE